MARALGRNTFREQLLDPRTSDEVVDLLRGAAKGIVEARTHDQLGAASTHLATAAFRVGIDAWPRFVESSQKRAVEAVSGTGVSGVINASSDGMDMSRAAGGVILGGLALYLMQRSRENPKPALGPATLPAPVIVEAVVPVPPPAEGEKPADVLKPGGQNVGKPGEGSSVRVLPGGEEKARKLFDRLTKGGDGATPPAHTGKVVRMLDGSVIGYRPKSRSGPPTIDVNVTGLKIRKLKFPERTGE